MAAHRFIVSRRAALGLAAGPLLLAAAPARAQPRLDRVSFVTNWRAQAEHGGFYQAQAAGLYRAAGLEVELRSGGPQINPAQLLIGGRVDMAMGNGLGALGFVREGIPFLCVAAVFQKDPVVLIGHPGQGIDGFSSLKGRPVLISAEPRVTWWPYVRQKFGLSDEQVRPYTFSLAPFLADKRVVQQGYLGSEPFSIRQQGVEPVVLLVHDSGFQDYGTTIHVGAKTLAERREVIGRFVDASMAGWDQYLKGRAGGFDTEGANRLIRQQNPDMGEELIAYGTEMMNREGVVRSGDALQGGIGAMTEARWGALYEAAAQVGVVPRGMEWRRAFDLGLVNKGIGKA